MKRRVFIYFLIPLIIAMIFVSMPSYAQARPHRGKGILIIRDDYGVPHIYANKKEKLAFGCGYAMAQDRLWQADLFRRMAFGNLAEFGLASIESDYQTRKLGYSREELLEIFTVWEPIKKSARLKEMMVAYVNGINLYISEALEAYYSGDPSLMPLEYLPGVIQDYGLPLEPFTIQDCVAIVVMMAWRFGGTGGNELGYASALQMLQSAYGEETGWKILNDLYPQEDPGAPTTIPSEGCDYSKKKPKNKIVHIPYDLTQTYQEIQNVQNQQLETFQSLGLPMKFGSNAWMVNSWKSATKNAIQVGGPQMGHSIPQIVLEVGLHGAGINAVGMMMPHAPSILIGVSTHGAWTSTTGASDLIDTYIEVLNPDNQYQYLYNGEWVDMEKRTEFFYEYGNPIPEEEEIYRTIHGPIIYWDEENDICFSMKTPFYKNELAAEEGWSLFQQAKNIKDMEQACKVVHASHNFYWIDRASNIGYWHCGTYPIKPTYGKGGRLIDDRFPLWGTGEEEWLGVTGFEEMPRCINPDQNYLANWNNKPIVNWPYTEADWGEVHRVKWIQEQLASKNKITFNDMANINKDTGYNHQNGYYFLDFLINAAEADSSISLDVVDALKSWNHHYNDLIEPRYPNPKATYDDPGLTIFDKWYRTIKNDIFDDDLPPGINPSDSLLLHVFDGEDSKLPLKYDYLNGGDRDEMIVNALKEALVYLESYYETSDISKWLMPVEIVTFSQLGAVPAPRMHAMNRGTYNHIAEMPRWRWWNPFHTPPPHAIDVIPPGQSGFIHFENGISISPHAYDQLPLYETWTYKPMYFRLLDLWKVAESWEYLN